MNPAKEEIARQTNPRMVKGSLSDALEGADAFIGVSAPGLVSAAMVESMAPDAIVFACADPTPEIFPDEAIRGGAAFESGVAHPRSSE